MSPCVFRLGSINSTPYLVLQRLLVVLLIIVFETVYYLNTEKILLHRCLRCMSVFCSVPGRPEYPELPEVL